MKITRRIVLRGMGGVALSLPFLEGLVPRQARAGTEVVPYAIFFRQANGVAQAANTGEIGEEPERFFPRTLGALDAANVAGRALDELDGFLGDLLVVKNVNMYDYDFGDGHARGAQQGLIARGPVVEGAAGDSEGGGESIDNYIARITIPDRPSLLFLYAGQNGWLGGPCISYSGPGARNTAIRNPFRGYEAIIGGDAGLSDVARMQLVERQQSVNDLVREQLRRVQGHPALSRSDRDRLQVHLDSIRDLEVALTCRMSMDQERMLEGLSPGYDSTDGNEVLEATRLHMQVAALAVACGHTRSVSIQVGTGNDGGTRYWNQETGTQMENYHYISHRRLSHDSSGAIIAGSDYLHHLIDRQFAQTFRHLLERLDAYAMPDGQTLLSHGVSTWYNDNSNGPPHGSRNVPFVIAGGANGYLRTGEYVEVQPGNRNANLNKMLNTLATAAGAPIDNFGDPALEGGLLTALLRS